MNTNKENLEGIVSKLKEQGIDAGEAEKLRIIDNAKKQAEQIVAEAESLKAQILEDAKNKAAQAEKNAGMAMAQASRDMVEATKIAMLNYLKSVFGKECKTLFTQEQYLQELLKAVLDSVSGNKSVKVAPEMQKSMETFLLNEALNEEVTLEPLSSSKTKIKMKLTDTKGVSFVLSSKDVEAGLFSLLNKDLVERITKNSGGLVMSNMVYLMCSLPSLTYGRVPPVSINEFNNDAKSQLSARHYKLLESVDIQKMDGSDSKRGLKSILTLLDDVKHDLFEIRNAKANNRQAKLERLPQKVIAGNPLEREKQIMRWQWEELDSIESGKTFTLTEVMVYKLKLQILCRMDSFHEEDGAKVLASVVNPSKNEEEN